MRTPLAQQVYKHALRNARYASLVNITSWRIGFPDNPFS
jgi:hypothetical protein